MKYLAIFLIIISLSAQSFNVLGTVIHVQSSKGKHIKASKAKFVKKMAKCPLDSGKPEKSMKAAVSGKDVEIYKH